MNTLNHSLDEHSTKGIFICVISYFFISLIGLCEKGITHGISLGTILFFQNAICVILMLPIIYFKGKDFLKSAYPGTLFARAAIGLACYAVLFYVIRFMPISEALIFQYSASLWIPFIMFFWLNVKVRKNLWFGIVIGFLGIILVIQPSALMMSIISLFGVVLGILQGLSMVAIRKLSVTEPASRILFYYFAIASLLTAPLMFKHGVPLAWVDIVLLIGVGVFTYISQLLLTTALKYANPATLAPICYTSILFSGILAWIFWDEVPNKESLLGMVLVVVGGIATLLISQRNNAKRSI